MKFIQHYDLAGKHAFLSASKYAWIRYDDEKLIDIYRTHRAAAEGSQLHAFADQAIKLGIKLPRSPRTINMYVNDAIGYKMSTEVVLMYSDNVFGTADAISFRKNFLRIHDLKSGVNKASFDQLLIYVAIFCLEYQVKPGEIDIELRIYQNDEVKTLEPDLDDILHIMSTIKRFDKLIEEIKAAEEV